MVVSKTLASQSLLKSKEFATHLPSNNNQYGHRRNLTCVSRGIRINIVRINQMFILKTCFRHQPACKKVSMCSNRKEGKFQNVITRDIIAIRMYVYRQFLLGYRTLKTASKKKILSHREQIQFKNPSTYTAFPKTQVVKIRPFFLLLAGNNNGGQPMQHGYSYHESVSCPKSVNHACWTRVQYVSQVFVGLLTVVSGQPCVGVTQRLLEFVK